MILHHVSLVSRDIDRAVAFYRDALGLRQIARPPFKFPGAWLTSGTVEVHLIDNPGGTFRRDPVIDTGDCHFAIRVTDFEAAIAGLVAKGYKEDGPPGDLKSIRMNRNGVVGYPQAYLIDPDWNIVELNAAA